MGYQTTFDPPEVQMLAEVMLTIDVELTNGEATRTLLAQRIMEIAETGEKNPSRIKAYALQGLIAAS